MADGDTLEPPVHGDPLTEPGGEARGAPGGGSLAAGAALLAHEFARPELLAEALTHRSAAGRRGSLSNERLEFVGDRVLGLLIAEWLAERFPREQEGDLGRRLAQLVSGPVLAGLGREIGLAELLTVAAGEARAGVRRRATVIADAMEAVIGALYVDGGIAAARRFVRGHWAAVMEAQQGPPKDAKTALQEWAQARGQTLPCYAVAERRGQPHAPEFEIVVTIGAASGRGIAGSKRLGEQRAAADLLARVAGEREAGKREAGHARARRGKGTGGKGTGGKGVAGE